MDCEIGLEAAGRESPKEAVREMQGMRVMEPQDKPSHWWFPSNRWAHSHTLLSSSRISETKTGKKKKKQKDKKHACGGLSSHPFFEQKGDSQGRETIQEVFKKGSFRFGNEPVWEGVI